MAVVEYDAETEEQDEQLDALHQWAMELLEDGREIRKPFEAQWWENLATYGGDLWSEYDIWQGKLEERPKPDHKVRLAINLAQPVVRTEFAKLIKNKPIIDVLARSNDNTDLNAADVGDKVLNHYVEKQFNMPRVRRRALHWVLITGLGGIFVDYDPTKMGETEVLVDPQGNPIFDPRIISAIQKAYRKNHRNPRTKKIPQGDLVIKPVSPLQLVWDFSKQYVDEADWIIVSDVYDVVEVERRWDKVIEPQKNVQPGVLERRLLNRFDLTSKMSMNTTGAQKLAEVHRLFIKPGHLYFPNGLELVYTDDEVIYVSGFPHQHGDLPVSCMGHIPSPGTRYPMSILQQVRDPVLELSKTESQMIENRNLMSNPPWLEYDQNRLPEEIQNKPGLRIKVQYMPGVPDPHPVQMPEIPGYVRDMVPMLKEHILEISGQGETSQGRVPAGARSGVAIAYLQEEDDTRLGPTVQEYEEMMERVAEQTLSVIAENYDAPRTIRIYRKHSEPEVFDFMGTMLAGVAGVNCQAGSALPRSKAAKQQFILDLWDRKLEQDPRRVREMLELSQGEPDEWEIDLQQAERENKKLMQGERCEVEEWYNHQGHQYVHRRFMKSADFEALPEEVQAVFREHLEFHDRFVIDQQRAAAEEAMMMQQNAATIPGGGGASGGQLANGMNNPGPQGPFMNPDDLSSVLDAGPQ